MTSASETALTEKIAYIREKAQRLDDLPNDVEAFCGDLVKIVRSAGYGGYAASVVATFGATLVAAPVAPAVIEQAVDKVWDERDKIITALGDSKLTLANFDPDMEVPVTIIRVADEWRNLKTMVQQAESDVDKTTLSSFWHGEAATRYNEMLTTQKKPLSIVALPQVFEEIAVSLENIATAELELYKNLATKLQELEAAIVDAASGAFSKSFDAPWGPVSAAGDLANVAEAAKTFIVDTIGDMAEAAATLMIETNRIKQNAGYQTGLPDNKWPAGVQTSVYPGGIKQSIGNGTSTAASDDPWEIGPAVGVAQQ
ncbi:hypothetical protein [Nocardia carnea]|uniref:WXG100 family type VII secretion target n=1 Tax=Nocardia carnea TaxID=37328 RepID=A0ABW7TQ97_9NOCA|nr:hypothetical protein [Nocardia carnea]